MWFSLSAQTTYFLWSIVMGAALAVLYDIVCGVRTMMRAGRLHVMLSDILFFAASGVMTSLFALPFNKGDVRAFIIFGEAVGFFCYRLTVGRLTGRFYAVLGRFIRRIIEKISRFIQKIFDLLLKAGARVVYNVGVIIDRLLNIVAHKIRKHRASAERSAGGQRTYQVNTHEQKKHKKTRGRSKHQGRRRNRQERKRR